MSVKTTYILVDRSSLKIPENVLEKNIQENINRDYFSFSTEYFAGPEEAAERASGLVAEQAPYIIACGGNKMVNAIASRLVSSESTLGIIPQGIVNGLASHLNINNFFVEDAMRTLNRRTVKQMDTAMLNDKFMVNIAGFGFDAAVAAAVNKSGIQRGPGLVWLVLKKYFSYRSFPVRISHDTGEYYTRVFWLAITNGKQYGTRLYINPRASVSDGAMDLCLIKKPTVFELPFFLWNMFRKNEFPSFRMKKIRSKKFVIQTSCPDYHIDGVTHESPDEVVGITQYQSLFVLVNK